MAGSPSTRAMGQGAAQVFDTSNLAQAYGQGKIMEEQRKAAAQKDFEKKVAELSGAADDIFKEKYYATRDDQYIRGIYNDLMKRMDGKWGKAIDPMSPEYKEYKEGLQNLIFEAKKSQESKELAQPFMNEMGKNPNEWRPESKAYMIEFMNTPGMVFDQSKIKKVNNFDIEKEFTSRLPQYRQTVQDQGSSSFYSKNGEVFGNYDRTRSTEALEDNQMQTFIKDLSSNAEAVEKANEIYGEEVAQLQAQGQDVDVWDLVYRDYKPRLKVDVTNASFSQVSGEGKEEPFNPNNIVEDVIVKIGTNKNYDPGWFGPWEKVIANKKTKMYQTVPIQDNVTISKGVIDMGTGKEFDAVGSFPMTMGSPFIYEGKMMVPAYIDKGTEGNVSVLIPAEQVQESFYKKGYDMKQMAQGLGVKNFGGQVIDGTSAKDRMLKLKAGK